MGESTETERPLLAEPGRKKKSRSDLFRLLGRRKRAVLKKKVPSWAWGKKKGTPHLYGRGRGGEGKKGKKKKARPRRCRRRRERIRLSGGGDLFVVTHLEWGKK